MSGAREKEMPAKDLVSGAGPYRTPAVPISTPASIEEREKEERSRALAIAEELAMERVAQLVAERRVIFLRDVESLLAPRYGDPKELQRRVRRWAEFFDRFGEGASRAALEI